VVGALLNCLSQQSPTDPALVALMRLGNDEGITPLAAAVAEGHETVAKVRSTNV
jgi:hypothetical protein